MVLMKSNCACHRLVWRVPTFHWWYLRDPWWYRTHGHRGSFEDGTKRYPQWPARWEAVRLHCFSCSLLVSTMHFISRRPTYGTLIGWKAYLLRASVASKCQHCTFCFFPPPPSTIHHHLHSTAFSFHALSIYKSTPKVRNLIRSMRLKNAHNNIIFS